VGWLRPPTGLTATPGLKEAGWIPDGKDKDGNPVQKLQTAPLPEDVAELCLFLASPAASALTGQVTSFCSSERHSDTIAGSCCTFEAPTHAVHFTHPTTKRLSCQDTLQTAYWMKFE
jgi:hypothetical protein